MIRWEERQRDGTGISHLGERKEEEGLVQSWVEEKCGHLVLSCSVSFLLGGFVLSNLASASASGAGAKSAVPPPLVAATYCLFPLPPAAAVFCANPGHLAHRRSPTRTRAPRYNGWAALQLPRRRGRASGSAAAICDTHSSYGGIPAPIFGTAGRAHKTEPPPHRCPTQEPPALPCPPPLRAGPPPIGSPPPPPREPAFDGMGARSTL